MSFCQDKCMIIHKYNYGIGRTYVNNILIIGYSPSNIQSLERDRINMYDYLK